MMMIIITAAPRMLL